MKTKSENPKLYCIWIDQKKAMIGTYDDEANFQLEVMESDIKTRIRYDGETTNKIRLNTSKRTRETSQGRKIDQQVKKFCTLVSKKIKTPHAVLITGPADMKKILFGLMKENKFFEKVTIDLKNADKMTEGEFKTLAFNHFFRIRSRRKFINS